MKGWWQQQSLKLRLTLWYALTASVAAGALAVFVHEVVEHRLAAELDRQLRIDFDLVEARLETDAQGKLVWPLVGSHGDEGFARLAAWFDVWSESAQVLLRHWPVTDDRIAQALPPPADSELRFYTVELEPGLFVRVMERSGRVHERGVILRVLRDESGNRLTLRQILEVSLLGLPLTVVLSAVGGYFIARRSLAPVGAMAEQARRITSESLGERLPNPNPHDELGQLAGVFNQTLERLEASFAELRRFTADASHELRTPLTALRVTGEIGLRDARDEAALREVVGSMLEEAQRLETLTQSLLLLARMEAGKVEPRREPVVLSELLHEVRESLLVLATEKQQTVEMAGERNATAAVDRLLLRQAVMNILHNAIRYSPDGRRITLRAATAGPQAIVEVTDEGPGIPAEHREKIFERFYRVDLARSRDDGGAGLGLAIARRAVELQGGRIEVESVVGRGSTFRVMLPT